MRQNNWLIALTAAFIIILMMNLEVGAVPNGATVVNDSTSTASAIAAGNRSDIKGSITAVRISTLQQNTRWKAYIGNVSGRLTLDDANYYTIYDWSTGAIRGEVYASRNSSITWTAITCVTPAIVLAEQTALGITDASTDSINRTFNWSGHRTFDVGTTTLTGCNSTVTYRNDTNIGQIPTAPFHEALLTDGASLVYAAIVNATGQSYRNDSLADFQMLVADNATSGSPAMNYYFWAELI